MANQERGAAPSQAQWLVLLAAFLGWMFDGVEIGIFPLIARPALRDLLHVGTDKAAEALVGHWIATITAAFLLGAAGGGLIFGWLGDRIGRVRAMTFSILTYSVFTGLGYFVTEPWQLGICRFLSALGMGGEWSLGVALVMEVWPEKSRPILAGAIGAAANVGLALIALVAMRYKITEDSWRWIMLVGAAPAILTFVIRLFVPESERWIEAVKDHPTEPVREIFGPALLKTTLLGIVFASVALIGTWGSVQWIPAWVGKMGKGVPEMATAGAQSQFVSAIGSIIGCFIGPLVGKYAGRRLAYFGLCLTSLVCCAYLFRHFDLPESEFVARFGTEFLVPVGVVGCFTAAFYGWLPLYLPELFPTRVRATGQGLCFNFGRIIAAAGVLGQGQLVALYNNNYARAGAMITLVYVLGMVLIWLAPETKDKPLPD